MSFCAGTKLHGFTVTRVREVAEQHGVLVEMNHDKTGASLVWLDNGEENKLFCVAFKTLPEDSTGVFHILEHSVLCGSEKYPVKEPFVELIKSSMNTFLNAMTFSDKTIYPVSSRNEQDFMNLTEVYLDAVFAPAILKNRNIFYQEGWHVEMDEEDKLSYKGVVFNEMKGAMSDVNELVYLGMQEMLFPDNCYGFNSGGSPAAIPQLPYEEFLDMYKRYYHPSNARIYLDGAVPLDRVLPLIDSYLARYERSEEQHTIPMQEPHACEAQQFYALAAEEDAKDRGYLSLGKIVGSWEKKTDVMAVDILMDAIMGSNEAPLKRALLASGLCQDVSYMVDNSVAQPWLSMTFINIKDDQDEALRTLVRQTVRQMVEKGLDRKVLLAAINEAEFRVRSPHEPAGLDRCINMLNTWLHDGDPVAYLENDADFAELRVMVDDGRFDWLLATLLLDESSMVVLHTIPSKTYEAELQAKEEANLAAILSNWDDEDRKEIRQQLEDLHAWQQTPDTAEQLATLPMLNVADIPEQCEFIRTTEQSIDGATVLTHAIPGSGITRLSMQFSLTDCTLAELSQISVMVKMLGELGTANYTPAELSLAKKTWLGWTDFSVDVVDRGLDRCIPLLTASCAVLDANIGKARELLCEMLTSTDFTDKNRLNNSLQQLVEIDRQLSISRGNMLAVCEASAGLTAYSAATEAVQGVTFGNTLKAMYDEVPESFLPLVKRVQTESICRERLVMSIVSDHADEMASIVADLPKGTKVPETAAYTTAIPMKSAYTIPAQIGYAALAADFRKMGVAYTGTAKVAANILSYSYLWNEVRVQGGAYGCGMAIQRTGRMVAHSFRDPTPGRTLGVYRKMAQALTDFAAGEESLEKYIISTVAENEPRLGSAAQKRQADSDWWAGYTVEDRQQERSEILHTDEAALLAWRPVLEAMAEQGGVCVVAHEGAIKACDGEKLVGL